MWSSSIYKGFFLLTLISGSACLIIGLLGLHQTLYADTGMKIEKDVVIYSEVDDSPIYLNYFTPRDEIETDVGVILAHGFSADREVFQKFTMILVEAGLNVAVFDERGHGDSGGLMSNIDWEGENNEKLVEQAQGDLLSVYNFLKSRGCDHIIVIGHSMGGIFSIVFSNRYGELVDATIAIGAGGPFVYDYVSENKPPNLLLLIGEDEEAVTEDNLLETLSLATGKEHVKVDTFYGNFSDKTARKVEIVSDKDEYIGHLEESSASKIIFRALDWIKNTGDSLGFSLHMNNNFECVMDIKSESLKTFRSLANWGITILFVPFITILSFLSVGAKPRSQHKLETLMQQEKFRSFKKFVTISVLASIIGVILAFISNHLNLLNWTLIMGSCILLGSYIGFGLIWYLFYYLKINRKNITPETIEIPRLKQSKRVFFVNLSIGIACGMYIGFMNFFCLTMLGFSSTIGGLPLKSIAWLAWLEYAVILIVVISPEESYLRAYQESIKNQKSVKKYVALTVGNMLVKVVVFCLLAINLIYAVATLIVFYLLASVLILTLVEIVSTWLYQITKSTLITATFNGILIAWFIISMVPFAW